MAEFDMGLVQRGARNRRTPYYEATQRYGPQGFTVYNHMYFPIRFDTFEAEFDALLNAVTIWDVSVERCLEISGPDGFRFAQLLTPRDLSKCAVGQAKYVLICDSDGGIVNDPVLLHVEEDRWWMQLADSDAGLYAMGVLSGTNLDAEVSYPDVHPVQVQGPHAAATLAKLVGKAIYDIRYYWCERFQIGDIPVVVSRTGWSAVPGFEVNLLDGSRGTALWDAIMAAGQEFAIRPIAPNEARRVEAGIFNLGSDMTLADTPFHVMGLERLVEEQPQDYIGKAALERDRREGVDRKLVGIEFDREEPFPGITASWPASHSGVAVGRVTDAVWSPGLSKNIGYVWVPIDLAGPGTPIDVESEHGWVTGRTAAIPFVDPRKERPAASLRPASA